MENQHDLAIADKYYAYDGIKVHYQEAGKGSPVILLHGWGCSTKTMEPILQHLKSGFQVYNFDLPGFGLSEEPTSPWSTVEYTAMLESFIKDNCEEKPIVIAHSFGGRLAIRLGAKNIPKKMILTGCAGLKPKRGMDYYFKVYSYKVAKKTLDLPVLNKHKEDILNKMRGKSGSTDYQNASTQMRNIFVRVVNEDLEDLLAKVTAPVVLYWGKEDTATPLSDGQTMADKMQDAGLIVMENATHYAYLECLGNFLAVTDSFLKPDRVVKSDN